MNDFIKITMANAESTIGKLKKFPPIMRRVALENVTKYLIEFGGGNALRWYPPARPQSTYVRTFKLQNSWKSYVGETRAYISSNVPYAPYPMGDPPAAKMRLIGWRGVMERIPANLSKAVAYAQKKVKAALGL